MIQKNLIYVARIMRAWLLGRNNMPKEWEQKGLKYIDE